MFLAKLRWRICTSAFITIYSYNLMLLDPEYLFYKILLDIYYTSLLLRT